MNVVEIGACERAKRWYTLSVEPSTGERDVDLGFERSKQWGYDGVIVDLTTGPSANRELVLRNAIANSAMRADQKPLVVRVAASEFSDFKSLDPSDVAIWNLVLHLPMETPVLADIVEWLGATVLITFRILPDASAGDFDRVLETLKSKNVKSAHIEFPIVASNVRGGWSEHKIASQLDRVRSQFPEIELRPPMGNHLESSEGGVDSERYPDPQITYSRRSVTTQPSISVIIPAYERTIETANCIRQLLRQRFEKNQFEIIVVDRGSHDSTVRDAETLLEGEARGFDSVVVKLAKPLRKKSSERNYRKAFARNAGAALARGEILVFLDEEILVSKNFLARVRESFKGSAMVPTLRELKERSFGVRLAHEKIDFTKDLIPLAPGEDSAQIPDSHWRSFSASVVVIGAALFREVGSFSETPGLAPHADQEFARRFMKSNSIESLDEVAIRQNRPFVNRLDPKGKLRSAQLFHRVTLDELVFKSNGYSAGPPRFLRSAIEFFRSR